MTKNDLSWFVSKLGFSFLKTLEVIDDYEFQFVSIWFKSNKDSDHNSIFNSGIILRFKCSKTKQKKIFWTAMISRCHFEINLNAS